MYTNVRVNKYACLLNVYVVKIILVVKINKVQVKNWYAREGIMYQLPLSQFEWTLSTKDVSLLTHQAKNLNTPEIF